MILSELFWDGGNMNFSVECDRAKCKESVGYNGIEISLTIGVLYTKR